MAARALARARGLGRQGVGDGQHHAAAAQFGVDAQLASMGAGLHAMLDGVFHQRLQQQRRQVRGTRARVDLPLHAQALAKAHLLYVQVAARQGDLVRQRGRFALFDQRVAEQIAQVFQQRLGPGRLVAHQGDGAVERVEQEMRAYARLQLGQPRRGGRRCAGACAQHQGRDQQGRQQRAAGGAGQPGRAALRSSGQHQHGAGIQAGQHAQQHPGRILQRLLQPLQGFFQAAGRDQPGEGGRQRPAGEQRQPRQPVAGAGGAEQGAHAQHGFHEQHGAQHHAHLAGVEHQRAAHGGAAWRGFGQRGGVGR